MKKPTFNAVLDYILAAFCFVLALMEFLYEGTNMDGLLWISIGYIWLNFARMENEKIRTGRKEPDQYQEQTGE